MAHCRVGYLLALLGGLAFFLFFDGAFSLYFMALLLVLPLFSLAVSLPGMLGAGAGFAASKKAIHRGESFTLTLRLESATGFPVGRVVGRIRCTNLLTGESSLLRRKGAGRCGGGALTAEITEAHCGLVECRVTRLKVCDLLGLFVRRLPPPEAVNVLSRPLELPPEEAPALLGEGEQRVVLRPRPGGGPGEDYDLRPYRPGDPMGSVHWKLSSKADALIVRETLEPLKVQAILTYDHFGGAAALDAVFDRLDAVSRGLIGRERVHAVRWADPVTGAVRSSTVSDGKSLRAFQYAAFSTPAPKEGKALPADALAAAGPTALLRRLHITPEGEGGSAP